MSESVKPNGDAPGKYPDDDGQAAPMKTSERWTAGIIGMAASGAGITAVFISDNQAGTAALFVVAVAFLLIGVQGTPLKRFASGDHSAEFDRRREARTTVAEATEAQEVGDQEIAEVLLAHAVRLDPSVENLPAVQALRYESRVAEALHRVFRDNRDFGLIAGEHLYPSHSAQGVTGRFRPDFVLSAGGNQINVEVKHLRGALAPLYLRKLMAIEADTGTPTLLVTNVPLSKDIMQLNGASQNARVEVVQWNGGNDDNLLERAARRLLRLQEPSPEP